MMGLRYDGDALRESLGRYGPQQIREFCAVCSEYLTYRYGEAAGSSHSETLRLAVGDLWGAVESGSLGEAGAARLQESLEEILENDGDSLGVVEHVIAGVYYALEASVSGEAGKAELVANNVYEAQDFVVISDPEVSFSAGALDQRLDLQPMQDVLIFLNSAMALVGDDSSRVTNTTDGASWLKRFARETFWQ